MNIQKGNDPQPRAGNTSRLLRLPQVLARFPVGRSSWYAGIAAGLYPRPVRIGKRSVAWREEEVTALIGIVERQQ